MRDLRLLHRTCFCWRCAAISLQLTESHVTRTRFRHRVTRTLSGWRASRPVREVRGSSLRAPWPGTGRPRSSTSKTFGMKVAGKVDNPGTRGVFLTDGDINLAILNFKNDTGAGVDRGKGFTGIH